MQVRHLSLANYRNYAHAELVFAPGMNMLVGRNGQGKTNVAEALMYLATLRSHRISQDAALIKAGEDSAIVRCRLAQGEREALLELQLNRGSANKALINRHSVKSRELTQLISAVLFAPEDLMIVRGEPATRRSFLDDALISRHPVAAGAIADYEKILRQRNTMLRDFKHTGRSASSIDTLLDVWDEQLVEMGSQIMRHRRMLIEDLRDPLIQGYFSLVDQDHQPTIALMESVQETLGVSRETGDVATVSASVSRETIAEEFRDALRLVRGRELERGQTLVGPHRDDAVLQLKSLPVKGYASHGETWSYVLSLKLALASVLSTDTVEGDPVLILDDVFAELDLGRRERLYAAVSGYEQVIVTTAVEGDVPQGHEWHTIRIEAGEVVAIEPVVADKRPDQGGDTDE